MEAKSKKNTPHKFISQRTSLSNIYQENESYGIDVEEFPGRGEVQNEKPTVYKTSFSNQLKLIHTKSCRFGKFLNAIF